MNFPPPDFVRSTVQTPAIIGGVAGFMALLAFCLVVQKNAILQHLGRISSQQIIGFRLVFMLIFIVCISISIIGIVSYVRMRGYVDQFQNLKANDIESIQIYLAHGTIANREEIEAAVPIYEVHDLSSILSFVHLLEQSEMLPHVHESYIDGYMVVLKSQSIANDFHELYIEIGTRSTRTNKPAAAVQPKASPVDVSLGYLQNPALLNWIRDRAIQRH